MIAGTIRGSHVFWAIGVFFAIMVAIETFFVVRAVATFPGEDVPNSYVLGLDYNRTVARRLEQNRLGWRVEAGLQKRSLLVVRVRDSADLPLDRLQVSALVHSIGKSAEGELVELKERSPGEYAAPMSGATGRVRLSIEVMRPGEDTPAFEAAKTLVIP